MINLHKPLCKLLKKKKTKANCVTNVKLVELDYYLSLCERTIVSAVLSRGQATGQATTSELKNSSVLLKIKK